MMIKAFTNHKNLFILLCIMYFVTRLFNITEPPILNDESTYIRYGIHQIKEPDHQNYSLLIGKEPFAPYVMAFLGTMLGDYLLGSRLSSVASGLFTLIGLYMIARYIYKKESGIVAMGIYIFAPLTLFYDRLGYIDSWVSTISVWSLYFLLHLLKSGARKHAVMLGLVLGWGMWVKSSVLFFIVLSLGILLVHLFSKKREKGEVWMMVKNIAVVFGLAGLIFLPLYFSPLYPIHRELMKQYTYPFVSVFSFPISIWWGNFLNLFMWLFFNMTPGVFLLGAWGMYSIKKQYPLIFWFVIPLLFEVLYAKLFASRHVLLLAIPIIIFASIAFSKMTQKKAKYACAIIFLVVSLYLNFYIILKPHSLRNVIRYIPRSDIGYGSGFASGYGVMEAIEHVEKIAQQKTIAVMIRDDHGNPEDAVVAYLGYNPQITLLKVRDAERDWSDIDAALSPEIEVYYITRGAYYGGVEEYIESEIKFMKPNEAEFVGVSKMARSSKKSALQNQ